MSKKTIITISIVLGSMAGGLTTALLIKSLTPYVYPITLVSTCLGGLCAWFVAKANSQEVG